MQLECSSSTHAGLWLYLRARSGPCCGQARTSESVLQAHGVGRSLPARICWAGQPLAPPLYASAPRP